MPRPTPFDLVFSPLALEGFPAIQTALIAAGRSPQDRDAFLITREAVLLLRELRPEEGLGEGINQLAALLHHAYLFWADGRPTGAVPAGELACLLAPAGRAEDPGDLAPARYVQLPERRVWARPLADQPAEPLDGCFLSPGTGARLRVLGVFGLHPDRAGFTVVEGEGVRSPRLARPDGTPLFAPTLPAGGRAGLHGLEGAEELVELGWRLLGVPVTRDARGSTAGGDS